MSREPQPLYLMWNHALRGGPRKVYRIAGRLLVADVALPLPQSEQDLGPRTVLTPVNGGRRQTRLIYRGPGFFAGGWRSVVCERVSSGFFLTAEARSGFHVSNCGLEIRRTKSSDPDFDKDVLLGPVMTLALALQGLFTLHLSAVSISGRAVCFLGRSGAGKSTAARYLGQHLPGATWLVDDTAPCLAAQELTLVGGLPQPNMEEGGARYPALLPSAVSTLLWLDDAFDDASGERPAIRKLAPREVARRLAASSIGTRLFDPPLLDAHLRFCGQATTRVAGHRSNLPKNDEALRTLERFLLSRAVGVGDPALGEQAAL